MFHDFDPMEMLNTLHASIMQLQADKLQLVNAINHQANAMTLLNKQVSNLQETIKLQEQQIKLLQVQLHNVGLINTMGFSKNASSQSNK
jgi:hypothetical protein